MQTLILVLLLAVLAALGILLVTSRRKGDPQGISIMQQQMDGLRQQVQEGLTAQTNQVNAQLSQVTVQVNQQLGQVSTQVSQQLGQVVQTLQANTGQISTRLDNAAKVVGEVRQNLGELSEATKRVYEVGKDISGLQDLLRAPKLRGSLGELFLGDLLSQILPASNYALQYAFKTGESVDAVLRIGPGLVPVDAKFPLEALQRVLKGENEEERKKAGREFSKVVKGHIDDIAGKYILPDEGTYDFALMYIPAENVYYETIIKDESAGGDMGLQAYALEKRVIPVSPNSFYAYLQVIILGLKGLKIEKSAQDILNHLGRLQVDFDKFKRDYEILGSHLTDARNTYERTQKRLDRFDDKLASLGQVQDMTGEQAQLFMDEETDAKPR